MINFWHCMHINKRQRFESTLGVEGYSFNQLLIYVFKSFLVGKWENNYILLSISEGYTNSVGFPWVFFCRPLLFSYNNCHAITHHRRRPFSLLSRYFFVCPSKPIVERTHRHFLGAFFCFWFWWLLICYIILSFIIWISKQYCPIIKNI